MSKTPTRQKTTLQKQWALSLNSHDVRDQGPLLYHSGHVLEVPDTLLPIRRLFQSLVHSLFRRRSRKNLHRLPIIQERSRNLIRRPTTPRQSNNRLTLLVCHTSLDKSPGSDTHHNRRISRISRHIISRKTHTCRNDNVTV